MGEAAGRLWLLAQGRRVLFWFQALLKKHEALMSDLSAYGSSIQALREQAQSCRVSVASVQQLRVPWGLGGQGR